MIRQLALVARDTKRLVWMGVDGEQVRLAEKRWATCGIVKRQDRDASCSERFDGNYETKLGWRPLLLVLLFCRHVS